MTRILGRRHRRRGRSEVRPFPLSALSCTLSLSLSRVRGVRTRALATERWRRGVESAIESNRPRNLEAHSSQPYGLSSLSSSFSLFPSSPRSRRPIRGAPKSSSGIFFSTRVESGARSEKRDRRECARGGSRRGHVRATASRRERARTSEFVYAGRGRREEETSTSGMTERCHEGETSPIVDQPRV